MRKFAFGCGGILLVIAFVAVVFAIGAMGKYNTLVKLEQNVDQSWAQVQNVYQRRADLIPNLVNTVQGAANFEKSTLIAVTEARASVGRLQINQNQAPASAQQLEQFQAAQGQLSNALSRLLVVAERYPELRANANFQQLQAQLEGTENRIAVERRSFNQAVQDYDTAVRSFPTVIYAGLMGFHIKPYFRAEPGAEKAPTVNFNFGNPTPAPAGNTTPAAPTP
ncbi:MAG TPA: LemA family protein [Chthoniobacterales bacterium]